MTKLEFIQELESLLSDIPLEEREEALQYYRGYFEDAGENNEAEIIKELVSPARVAAIIKEDLNLNTSDRDNRGYYTEQGYQNTFNKEQRFEVVGSDNTAQQRTRNNNIGLIILLCILGAPIIMSALGVLFGIAMAIVGILFGFGIAGVVMMGVGIALFVTGLIKIGVPFVGILLCGSGLIVLGLGMLFALACITLCKKVIPGLIRGIVQICRRPFQNRSVTA